MNKHILLDKLTATIGAWTVGQHKYFATSIDSAPFAEHLDRIHLPLPQIEAGPPVELQVDTLAGQLDPAFWVYCWQGADYPTLIVHHGNSERPFDTGRFSKNIFRNVLLAAEPSIPANLIILRAPFHRDTREYATKSGQLSNWVAMLAVSVRLVETLVQALKQQPGRRVLVTGISLGGWVTNLHRTHFNSADSYLPLLAGGALAEVFLTSVYQKMTGRLALNHPERLRHILNFEDDFASVPDDNVYPLLARYDQYIQYERQKRCYGQRPINVLEKGHITAAMASDKLREHLLRHIGEKTRPNIAAASPGGYR